MEPILSLLDDIHSTYGNIMQEEDLDRLVAFWCAWQDVRNAVGELNEDLQAKIYDQMGEKEKAIEGVGVITRYRSSSQIWDDQEMIRRLRMVATNESTGEVDEGKAFALLTKAAKISYWRKGDLPFKPDEDVLTTKYGARKIRRD